MWVQLGSLGVQEHLDYLDAVVQLEFQETKANQVLKDLVVI